MASRRAQRRGRAQSLLPLHASHPSNSVSCWYCDFKIYVCNEFLFSFGRRYRRFLKIWFAVGVAFSLMALFGASVILLWDLAGVFHLSSGTFNLTSLLVDWSKSWSFDGSSLVPVLSMSVVDVGITIVSTLMSVALHEFGHAIAAASEGLQIQYIAIFLAILFPGALVALNYDLLQSLSHFSALRIYCAGIWHNVMFCAVCLLTQLSLPLILSPLYVHGEGPMVLAVPQMSPLSGYLSPHDVIVSVDGSVVKNPHEWMKMMTQLNAQMLPRSYNPDSSEFSQAVGGIKGYCVPDSWIDGSGNVDACPDGLMVFVRMSCFGSSSVLHTSSGGSDNNRAEDKICLIAKDVVKLTKCGNGWQLSGTNRSNCLCSEEESCMVPLQIPGMSWVEISYSSPHSSECLQLQRNLSSAASESLDFRSTPCGGSFVYVGDALSVASSIQLSAYRPRWSSLIFAAHVPYVLEKVLTCTFHVSATLVLLNSLPVYFLDGECILGTSLCYITGFNPRQRRKVLRFCLVGGTVSSIIAFSRIIYFISAIHTGPPLHLSGLRSALFESGAPVEDRFACCFACCDLSSYAERVQNGRIRAWLNPA